MAHELLTKSKELSEKLSKFTQDWLAKLGTKSTAALKAAPEPIVKQPEADTSSSLARVLLGPVGVVENYYFPQDLIGGCCPRVIGEEADIVWNAAAEASDSERVHVVWQARGDKVWFLAVRSAEMGSHPNTWCPFAALLPGMKDARPPPAVYTYYSDEVATMMTILEDGLHIHRGTTSVVRAKAERSAREFGEAPVIELVPDTIEKLTPMPWFSLSLFEERARRILAAIAVVTAIGFAALCLFIWFVSAMTMVSARTDLKEIMAKSREKSIGLMKMVEGERASPMREQLAKFSDVNDGLLALNGWLDIYQIKNGKLLWRALVPPNVTSDRINELGGQTLDSTTQGVIIGNNREAMQLGRK